MADVVANIIVTVATALASPIHRQIKYLFCVNKVVNDLEDARNALTEERDNMKTRIEQAEKKTEVIETSVGKWVDNVEFLLKEVDDLVQRTKTDIYCFQGWFPMRGRYVFCKQMMKKIKAMGKFIGTSKDIQPFSHLAPLRGIPIASEDFIYFASTQKAYDELFDALKDNSIHMIGLYGAGGSGKTTLASEVGNKAAEQKMFDMVIPITVSQTPNIEGILGKIADRLGFNMEEVTVEGRTERLWKRLEKEKDNRILIIVDDLWSQFNMMDIGISHVDRHTWKILVVTHNERICTLMDCQKMIHLRHLSEDESWTLFQKIAKIDVQFCELLDGVPQKICNECKGVLLAIKTMASSLKGMHHTKWKSTLDKLVDSKAFDGHEGGKGDPLKCIKVSYDGIRNTEEEVVFLMCCIFPADYHIPIEDLTKYAQGVFKKYSFQLLRCLVEACINRLLESSMLMRGSVKMHSMVRDAALWIANRSDNNKILVNVDKPLSTVAEDIGHCFAVSSWWYNENPSFCQLHAPNLKILLLNISAHSSLNSLDLSPLTFEGIQGLQVFSLTINYKIIPLSFPPSIQLLTNVRTLRLNGLKLGDISFILSLIILEVLDLRRCYFNELPIELRNLKSLKLLDLSECHFFEKTYNRAIGKCSQLEELYASKCYPHKYVDEIIMDICILPNLQRFVLGDPIIPERTRVVQVNDFNISKLTTSNKNILQIAETISLRGLHGGSKNIIPDMVGFVGGMNNLSTLHLTDCTEIECIFDTTCDFKEDDLIPKLVELRLQFMFNLTELCHDPPQQVLQFFEKLEVLEIDRCSKLHIIFPTQCNLRNLKILSLSYCKTDEVLFSESISQSLQQLEQITIHGCTELKHIISASGSEHGGCNTSEEIVPAPMNSLFLMTNIRDVNIYDCQRLESIFPLCYVERVPRLQKMHISHAPNLKYVFGKCDDEHLSSYQNQNHVMLPHLEVLKLRYLDNLIGMCPENYQANWPSQSLRILTIDNCRKMAIPWFNLNAGHHQSQHHLNEIWRLQCLQSLTLGDCEELKCLFSMETHRSLPELMYLCVYNCQKLEQIVAANEELVELPNAELYFPKLKQIKVENCNKLKSVFPFFMVTMLPQLISLRLLKATQLQEVFRHGQGDNIVNKMEIVLPNMTEVTLADLPNFEDICHGCKLHAIELLQFNISNCPKFALGLTKIQRRSDFNEVGYRPALYEIGSSSATRGGEKLETRESFKEDILKALRDPKASNIGIYGLGGVGKTFLVKEIADIAIQQKLFNAVIITLVSNTPDIEKIQWVIADMLGLKFEEKSTDVRAMRLKERIKAEKSVLIILDDIWQRLELEKVGIPSNKEHIGCKLLMTSRTQDVLLIMDVQKDFTFRLELLSETETWSLFQSKAGDVVNDSSLNDLATQVAKECKGLPLLIVTVASRLKGKDIPTWNDELSLLQSVGHAEMEDIARSVLEFSYKRLANDEIKALFLLSAVLGGCSEDYLLKVTMALHIFKNINDTVAAARNRLHSIIELLKASCLLLESNNTSRYIQMHDLVRDVGISIACRNKDVYILKPKTGLKEYLTMDFPKMCSRIILLRCLFHQLPKKLDCPNVELFILDSANRSLEIPDTIFDGMGSLKVLDLTRLNLSSLPTSLCSLTGLQTLCLDQCILENIDIIGDLKNLEILSLWKSSMTKLPIKIREMTQLRMLDLSNSGIEVIPSNIFSSLTKLEELYLGNTSIKWEDENSAEQKENASLSELQRLRNLTTLELQIHNARILPRVLKSMFEKLQRYKIAIGDVWEWSDIEHTTLNTLMLKLDTNIHSELGIKALIKGVENLYLDEVDGLQNVLYEMNREGFPLLSHLHIQNNAKMKHIVYFDNAAKMKHNVSFPKLETLSINNLENLEKMCHGPLAIKPFGKLSVIKVKNCAKLTYLLSVSMVERLSNLSEIEVCQCNSTENIVLGDMPDEKVEFSSLRTLTLQQLDKLDSFFCSELKTSSITSTSPFFSSQVAFPNLETLKLSSLNLNKIWDENQHSMYNKLTVLIVENCGELKYLFSSTMVQSFVNLKRLEIKNCNLMNEIIAQTALNVVPFPKLETIMLKDMENLKTVWHYQFDTVKTLQVQNCEKIVVVFPSSMEKTYNNLEMLVVKDCALVENIFELSSSEISSIESETQLKVITLDQLPKLIKIWSRDTQGILSFHKLQNVFLNQCDSIEYLFPFSVATACPHLEVLEIKYCGKMKEIVSEKTDSTRASHIFEFNQLYTILFWRLDSLKGFYAGNHILACPSLRKLDVADCAKLNLYKTAAPPASSLQICEDENLSDFLFQPLFIVEEVIPNLEQMRINDRDAMMIMQAQNLDSLFNKLTFLGVAHYKNDEATFPYWFLQNALSLEWLVVEWSSFKKIFEDERLVSMKIHTRLKKLFLNRLPKLHHICEEGSQIDPVLEVLEHLYVDDCPSLTNLLLPSSVTFSHLTYLEIIKCNKLVNLITSSTVQSLVKLRELKVEDCDSLQEIIMGKEDVDIAFVSLELLILKGLPSLNNFCSSKCCLKFPLLEHVFVSNCPSMEIFSEGNTSTPSLRKVRIEENSEEWYWNGNLNDTIKVMFEDKSMS